VPEVEGPLNVDALTAAYLVCGGRHATAGVAAVRLCRRGRYGPLLAPVDDAGGVIHRILGGHHIDVGIGESVLDRLERPDGRVELHARRGPVGRVGQCGCRGADHFRRDHDPADSKNPREPLRGLAHLAYEVRPIDLNPRERHIGAAVSPDCRNQLGGEAR
jgi:hypothetical protein